MPDKKDISNKLRNLKKKEGIEFDGDTRRFTEQIHDLYKKLDTERPNKNEGTSR